MRVKYIIKKAAIALTSITAFFYAIPGYALNNLKDAFKIGGPLDQAAGNTGAGYKTSGVNVETLIGLGIATVLSFVGVIFLILAIYGGYIWMLARGNEQEVERAKEIIKNSIIGLVVVIAAYAISWYIINALGGAALQQASPPGAQPSPTVDL